MLAGRLLKAVARTGAAMATGGASERIIQGVETASKLVGGISDTMQPTVPTNQPVPATPGGPQPTYGQPAPTHHVPPGFTGQPYTDNGVQYPPAGGVPAPPVPPTTPGYPGGPVGTGVPAPGPAPGGYNPGFPPNPGPVQPVYQPPVAGQPVPGAPFPGGTFRLVPAEQPAPQVGSVPTGGSPGIFTPGVGQHPVAPQVSTQHLMNPQEDLTVEDVIQALEQVPNVGMQFRVNIEAKRRQKNA